MQSLRKKWIAMVCYYSLLITSIPVYGTENYVEKIENTDNYLRITVKNNTYHHVRVAENIKDLPDVPPDLIIIDNDDTCIDIPIIYENSEFVRLDSYPISYPADFDGDYVNDLVEISSYHSSPFKIDSDNDSIVDGREILLFKTSPIDADSDNDGISDSEEIPTYYKDTKYHDFNNDGYPDVIFVNHTGYTYICWGDSTNSFVVKTELPCRYAIPCKVADLNRDGYLDIVMGIHRTAATVYTTNSLIYWGDASCQFDQVTQLPTVGCMDLCIDDIDNDGYFDIVVANNKLDSNTFAINSYVYWGDSSYSYSEKTELYTEGASGVATADLNKDGYKDLVFCNTISAPGTIAPDSFIYWGSQNRSFPTRSNIATNGANDCDVIDFDGNGWLDIIFVSGVNANSNAYLYWGAANNPYATKLDLPAFEAIDVSVADLNADQYLDIVISNYHNWEDPSPYSNSTNSFIYWGNPNYTFEKKTELPTRGAKASDIADLNNDGCLDVIFGNDWDGTHYLNSYIYWGDKTHTYSHENRTEIPTTGVWDVSIGYATLTSTGGGSDPTEEDTDQDGLSDAIEREIGSDPNNADTDNDGMPDGWEYSNFLNPLDDNDIQMDNDSDNLSNLDEYLHGCLPGNPDTDDDGLTDGEEVIHAGPTINVGTGNVPVVASNGNKILVAWAEEFTKLSGQFITTDGFLEQDTFEIGEVYPVYSSYYPTITSDGYNFLVAWPNMEENITYITSSLIDKNGNFLSAEYNYNIECFHPILSSNGDNYCLVSKSTGLTSQILTLDGLELGLPVIIDNETNGYFYPASMASNGETYFLTWFDTETINGQLMDNEGQMISNPFLIDSGGSGDRLLLNSLVASDGVRYMLIWNINDDIYGQIFDANANPIGRPRKIGSNTYYSSLASNGTSYFVSWFDQSYLANVPSVYYGQFLNRAGEKIGTPIELAQMSVNNYSPSSAPIEGGYITVWQDNYNIKAKFIYGYGTNPTSADSDSDGINDRDEIKLYKSDPLNPDFDDDGLSDGDEVRYHTNIFDSDTDNDGLADSDEINFYLTSPILSDSDNDGLSDGDEVITMSPEFNIGNGTMPSVAFNGKNYCVVWSTWNDIHAQFVNSFRNTSNREPQKFLSGDMIALTSDSTKQVWPTVASDGNNFLVIWESEKENDGYGLQGTLLNSDAIPGDLIDYSFDLSSSEEYAFLSSNGSNYLMTFWQRLSSTFSQVLDESGHVVGSEQLFSSGLEHAPVVTNGQNYCSVCFDMLNISAQFFDNEGSLVGQNFKIHTGTEYSIYPSIASDGNQYLATWRTFSNKLLGQYFSDYPKHIGEPFLIAENVSKSFVACNGTNYLVVHTANGKCSVEIYNSNGQPIEKNIIDEISISGPSNPNIASNGNEYFLVWSSSNSIMGKFIKGYATDPLDADSDDDGISDAEEINLYHTDPLNADYDRDGLLDGIELQYNTDPINPDTDNDGLPDGWEEKNSLNPCDTSDALLDNDCDGLNNLAEFESFTNPHHADSDNDGLSDNEYLLYGTSPIIPDTDNDGMPDGWETTNQLNPLNPDDSSYDNDGDNLTNQQEYDFGTDPLQTNITGSIPGQFSVDASGAAVYSIPITVPPGTAGISPDISLSYSSNAGNGILGIGWSLTGLSAITRAPATLLQDGFIDGIDFDENDRFAIDGQRLMAVNGEYGADGTEYRTEIESFTRVISYGRSGNGPAYFKAWTKAGLIMEYGLRNGSQIKVNFENDPDNDTTLMWSLNKISDTKGNYIDFKYYNDNDGEYYLNEIVYTGNDTGNLSPYNSIKFEYENRPDLKLGYQSGSKFKRSLRLKNLSIFTDTFSNPVRRYSFEYLPISLSCNENFYPQYSRLNKITLYGSNNTPLPSTLFNWQSSVYELTEQELYTTPYGYGFGVLQGELNGDGLTDLVHWGIVGEGQQLAFETFISQGNGSFSHNNKIYNTGDGFRNVTNTADDGSVFDPFNVIPMDVNGDGLTDFVHMRTDNYTHMMFLIPHLSDGQGGFVKQATYNTSDVYAYTSIYGIEPFDILQADINADGLMDLLHVRTEGERKLYVIMHISNGDGTFTRAGEYHTNDTFTDTIGDPYNVFAMDINGDGLIDLVHMCPDTNGILIIKSHISDGKNSFYKANEFNTGDIYYKNSDGKGPFNVVPLDLNGDGAMDFMHMMVDSNDIMTFVPYLSRGDGSFFRASNCITESNELYHHSGSGKFRLFPSDMNADGLMDIIHIRQKSDTSSAIIVTTYISMGNGSLVKQSPFIMNDSYSNHEVGEMNILPSDINGDALTDLIRIRRTSNNLVAFMPYTLAGNPPQNITKISDGSNVEVLVNYKSATDNSVYDKKIAQSYPVKYDPSNPIITVEGPMYLVSSYTTSNGIGGMNTYTYQYGNYKIHLQRGPLGFQWIKATDNQTNSQTCTTYSQEYPFIGMPLSTEVKLLTDNSVLTTSQNILDSIEYDAGKRHYLYIKESQENSYELNGDRVTSITTTNNYDDFGNAVRIVVDSNDGYKKTTRNQYFNDVDNWFLGRLIRAEVTAEAPGQAPLTRVSIFNYDYDSGLLVQEAVEPETDLCMISDYEYDVFGNKIKVSSHGNTAISTAPPLLDSLHVSPCNITVALHEQEQFNLKTSEGYALSGIKWSIDGGGTIDGLSGLFTADNEGVYTISAEFYDRTVTAQIRVASITLPTHTIKADQEIESFSVTTSGTQNLLAWHNKSSQVYAQLYDTQWNEQADPFVVRIGSSINNSFPVVASLQNEFYVSWIHDSSSSNGLDVFGDHIGISGQQTQGNLIPRTYYGDQNSVCIGRSNSHYLIVWKNGSLISRRCFYQNGMPYNNYTQNYAYNQNFSDGCGGLSLYSEGRFLSNHSYTILPRKDVFYYPSVYNSYMQYLSQHEESYIPNDFIYVNGSYIVLHGSSYSLPNNAYPGNDHNVNERFTEIETPCVLSTDNAFLIVWDGTKSTSNNTGIYAQKCSSTGATIDNNFTVFYNRTDAFSTNVSGASAGNKYLLTWEQGTGSTSPVNNRSSSDIFCRIIDTDGTFNNGKEFRLNTPTNDLCYAPVAASYGENFLITWSSIDQQSNTATIWASYVPSSSTPDSFASSASSFRLGSYIVDNYEDDYETGGLRVFTEGNYFHIVYREKSENGDSVKTIKIPNNPQGDSDGDSLNNQAEFISHTNPYSPDTDNDSLSDGYELLSSHTDPLCSDTDFDGYPDNTDPDPLDENIPDQQDDNSTTQPPPSISDEEARQTKSVYDNKGQFVVKTINALGQSSTMTYDSRFGTLISSTGPNNLTTSWEYDEFGRKIRETRADATETTWLYSTCGSKCPDKAYYFEQVQSTATPPVTTYYDNLGRIIKTQSIGFNGRTIFQDKEYNALGQTTRESRKYYQDDSIYWNEFTYDAIGRVTKVIAPDGSETLTTYNGLSTIITNPLEQHVKHTNNSQGKLVQVMEEKGYITRYEYDAFDNLIKTIDNAGNTVTIYYDKRGQKIAMDDPDMGYWEYKYNIFGELIWQKDAKGQIVTLEYDKLGRQIKRTEPSGLSTGVTTWEYDTGNKAVGKLTRVNGVNGYKKEMFYDNLGRSSQVNITIDGETYIAQTTYDDVSRVDTVSYPTKIQGGFSLKNVYNNHGYLSAIKNAQTDKTYWKADAVNAYGKITYQSLGNGLLTSHQFDDTTGFLQSIVTGNGASLTVQNLSYTFDEIGNLLQRTDSNQGITENFSYDELNRLTSAELVGIETKSYQYDPIGNLTYKSDVGSYVYGDGSAGPHAVTSISGTLNTKYTYDLNGNMISGNGRTIQYSAFNKPEVIATDNDSLTFYYDTERNRYKQVAQSNDTEITTVYLGAYEQVTTTTSVNGTELSHTKHKHYISAPSGLVAIYLEEDNDAGEPSQSTRYFHKDHLNSVDTVTDENGNVIERLSYDPHGKRRYPNGQDDPANALTCDTTKRGFTGHEHLDSVGLVHMNGRVYDPLIGRFLSPDPHVQSMGNPQSLNRYSYVLNNPLSFVDPSGYFSLKKFFKKFFKPLLAIAVAILIPMAPIFASAQYLGAFCGGFASGLISSDGNLKSALISGFTAIANF